MRYIAPAEEPTYVSFDPHGIGLLGYPHMAQSLIKRFEHNTLFTEPEAWLLFQIGAFAEACGWTLLIIGIAISHYTGSNFAVIFAGQTHGILFLGYASAAVGLYPTLGWSRKKACIALVASVPPYGSLIFEQLASHIRSHRQFEAYRYFVLWIVLAQRA